MSTPQLRQNPSPVEPLVEPERWSLPLEMDQAVLLAHAHRARDAALAATLKRLGRGVTQLWRKAVAEPIARWEARERTIRELSAMRAHELAELGIAPGMISYVASGKYRSNEGAVVSGSPVANENAHRSKVA